MSTFGIETELELYEPRRLDSITGRELLFTAVETIGVPSFREQFDTREAFIEACKATHYIEIDGEIDRTMRGQKLFMLAHFLDHPGQPLGREFFIREGQDSFGINGIPLSSFSAVMSDLRGFGKRVEQNGFITSRRLSSDQRKLAYVFDPKGHSITISAKDIIEPAIAPAGLARLSNAISPVEHLGAITVDDMQVTEQQPTLNSVFSLPETSPPTRLDALISRYEKRFADLPPVRAQGFDSLSGIAMVITGHLLFDTEMPVSLAGIKSWLQSQVGEAYEIKDSDVTDATAQLLKYAPSIPVLRERLRHAVRGKQPSLDTAYLHIGRIAN